MATCDLVISAGGKPGNSLNLRHAFAGDTSPTTFCDRLAKGLNILANDTSTKVILINLLGSIDRAQEVAEVIAEFIQHENSDPGSQNYRESHFPSLVVRLAGSEFNLIKDFLATLKTQDDALIMVENLDEAVTQAVRLAKSAVYNKV
jgi:succinyl-CoA synthetase beta subunit